MDTLPSRAAVAYVPDFPVIATGSDPDAPVAITEERGARRTVVACSAAAREAGVRRGQRIRDAQRLCPHLCVHPRDQSQEARAFEPVVAAAENLAAGVEVLRPGLLALSARGPARYHGGERRLGELLRDAVAELTTPSGIELACGVGIADGIFAAELAARTPGADAPVIIEPGAARQFLAPFALPVLGRPQLAETLRQLGLTTLGAFAALPGEQVANRFGADGVLAHRLARGLDPRPPAPRRPADELAVVHEFDPPAGQDTQIVFVGKSLADRLHAILGAAGVTCVRIGVEITTQSGRTHLRLWRHADGSGSSLSSLALSQRLRWQLDAFRALEPREHADPVVLLRLIPDQLVVDGGSQQALWGAEQIPDRVERAAERVQAMLGGRGVLRAQLTGGRDPLSRVALVAWGDLAPAETDPHAPWPGVLPAPSPPIVPPQPYPADLRDGDGRAVAVSGRARISAPPARLTVQGRTVRITGWAGPWIYDERWWSEAPRRRARLQVGAEDGRAYLLALEGGAWAVEGIYQ
jgi:protein ImuB